jgi:RNA polymerase sigma-B factor
VSALTVLASSPTEPPATEPPATEPPATEPAALALASLPTRHGPGAAEPQPAAQPLSAAASAADARTEALFLELAEGGDPGDQQLAREELIRIHLPMADFMARRFRNRGEPLDDLRQVAAVGLIKAIDGYDPLRGATFRSYAIPTVLGELRRHFRDKGWQVRAPRRLQELRAEIIAIREPLTQQLGRPPSSAEVAAALEVTEAEVREGLVAAQAYSATSLQTPVSRQDDGATLGDLLPGEENGFDLVEAREALRSVLAGLPERERRILGLRFFHQLSQSEISVELGISQMHVSRLLSRSLGYLRHHLELAG